MLLNGKVETLAGRGPKPLSMCLSVVSHVFVLVLIAGPRPPAIPKSKTAYDLMIKGREQKLVWYHFKEKLPDVNPAHAKSDSRPLRAEQRARQSLVSSPKNAPKAPQMIWQPAPEINSDLKVDSVNLVAVSLPKIEPPKRFVPPAPQPPKLNMPQAYVPAPPELQAANATTGLKPVELAAVARPVREFKAPGQSVRKTSLPGIEVAAPPELKAGGNLDRLDIASASLPTVSRPLRDFKVPAPQRKGEAPQIRTVDPAPSLAAGDANGRVDPNRPAIGQLAETSLGKVYKPFSAPPAGQGGRAQGKESSTAAAVPAAPNIDASGNTAGELNLAVVGLNPSDRLPKLPAVSRPAEFSAGPAYNPTGGAGDGKSTTAVNIPDLTIRGGGVDTRSTLMARNTPPRIAIPNAADSLREAAKYITVDEIGHPSATRVSSAPDSRFDGRAIYMMAIQMPNITSYSGSWLMWFSERTARPISSAVITAPAANRKVDPKYIAAAISERVEGTVRLEAVIHKDGTVGSVELVRGIDERLDRTAREALAKWQFTPAMRNGEPIDVDILVEIPFRLAPLADRR